MSAPGFNKHHGASGICSGSTTSTSTSCTDGDEFPRAVAKAAVAQICEGAGFHSIQRSALDSLADIAVRYLANIGKTSHFYANLAGRTDCNVLDVIMALEDVSAVGGAGGFVEIHKPLSSSASLKDVMRFVEYGEEMPFAKPVPHFPISKKRSLTPSFAQIGEKPPQPHIPSWLPALPDPHTYKSTAVWNERQTDPRMDKLEQARQRRKAERSLCSLYLRLSSSGAGPSSEPGFSSVGPLPSSRLLPVAGTPAGEQDMALARPEADGLQAKGKGKKPGVGIQNPFLAPPLPSDVKEVSNVAVNGRITQGSMYKKQAEGQTVLPSVLEAFAPALDAFRNGLEQPDAATKQSEGSVLPDAKDRAPVCLTFDFGRRINQKAIAANRSLGVHHSSPPKKDRRRTQVQTKEEEKYDKKRRAEQILAQAMEGSEDAAQS